MYQYKAILKSSSEIIAEGHNIKDVEHKIVAFKRTQKQEENTRGNEPIKIFHSQRDHVTGKTKDILIKIV